MKPIDNPAVKACRRGLSSVLLGGALCLAAQTAAAQLLPNSSGTLDSTTSTLSTATTDVTSTATSLLPITLPLDLSGLTATVSGLSLTLLDPETTTGTVTLTNTSPGQSLQISSIALVMEFIGSGGATAPCPEISFFPNVAAGAVLGVGESLSISFTAVCTSTESCGGSTVPLDLHEIMNLIMITFEGSDTVWTSAAVSHL